MDDNFPSSRSSVYCRGNKKEIKVYSFTRDICDQTAYMSVYIIILSGI